MADNGDFASEVVREGLRLLEQREQEDKAKLEWLRAAAKEGFATADHGDYVTLRSDQEIDDFVDQAPPGSNRKNSSLKKCVAKSSLKKHAVRLTRPAQRDLSGMMEWTVQQFGERAALRYDAQIKQALKGHRSDPERPGSKERPEIMIEGARTYHLSLSRTRVSQDSAGATGHTLRLCTHSFEGDRAWFRFTRKWTNREPQDYCSVLKPMRRFGEDGGGSSSFL